MTPSSTPTSARFNVLLATLSNTSITAGERVQIALRVENVGEQDGTFETALFVNDERVATESLTVEAGATQPLVFERRFEEPGEYEIAVGETSLGNLTVTAATEDDTRTRTDRDDGASPIEVVGATVPADWVKQGYATAVRVTVMNTANQTANRSLTVTVDDQPVANQTVTLQPNERDVVTIQFEAVGGTVAVEGVEAGRIQVGGSPGEIGTEADDTTGDGGRVIELGGFNVVAGAMFLAGVLVLLGWIVYLARQER